METTVEQTENLAEMAIRKKQLNGQKLELLDLAYCVNAHYQN